jgi:hypothetical protein
LTTEVKHWRFTASGQYVRSPFTACGLRTDVKVKVTSQPRLITCQECRRQKELRAAVARQRAAGLVGA